MKVIDPRGPITGASCIYRGGSWSSSVENLVVSNRYGASQGYRDYYTGFRPVCNGIAVKR